MTSSNSSWAKTAGAAVATATANAASANPGFLDNDLIILASFNGLYARFTRRNGPRIFL